MSGELWVLSGPLPCAAARLPVRNLFLGTPTHRKGETVWVEVNILGQHLPQMYRLSELHMLLREDCAALGLCADCCGMGSSGPVPCPACAGSGRPALRVLVRRGTGYGMQVDVRPLPHAYVPPDPVRALLASAVPDICLACGFPPAGTGPHGEALHSDDRS